jgi:ribose/xylose/arabinose/galactoside ABC-type transport system permease subunit
MNFAEKELIKKGIDKKSQTKSIIKNIYIYIILIIIVVLFSVINLDRTVLFGRGNFISPDNIINMLRMAVPIIMLSGGFTLLMISGNIDLSVGSQMSLSAVMFAYLILNGFPFLAALAIIIILGLAMGAINGFFVMKLRITPVIATLVTLNLYKGIALLMVPHGLLSIKSNATQTMPAWINDYGRKSVFLGLPWAFFVAVAVIAVLIIIQRKTIIGKYAAAIGGNRTAAELSGINAVKWVWILYIIVGLLAALAGMARASYMSVGDPLSGSGMETSCIIAVLLGGTLFSGGEGSVMKTIIGALIIMSVTTGLLTVIPAFWQTLAIGGVLIIAVALNHVLVQEKVKA